MALNLPTFYKRTASAIVFVAIMAIGLFWNVWSFAAMVCLVDILCLREYFKLMKKIDADSFWPAWLAPVIIAMSVGVLALFISAPGHSSDPQFEGLAYCSFTFVLPVLCVLPALLLIVCVVSKQTAVRALLQAFGGLFYITVPMVLLFQMQQQNWILPVALIFMIWSNDTMAYLVGSFIGKTPFSPISPKKTWEGTGGGALITMVAAGVYGYYSHKFRVADWVALGLCATVAGTLGDLVESKLKRLADVKDSGAIMPGHGGALDRFDSLLLAAPFAAAYVLFVMK